MTKDKSIEEKIFTVIEDIPNIEMKRMFGGTGYLMNGNMLCGAHKGRLILRLGPGGYHEFMGMPYARPFDITGKAMKGWGMADSEELSDEDYQYWIEKARAFVETLPSK